MQKLLAVLLCIGFVVVAGCESTPKVRVEDEPEPEPEPFVEERPDPEPEPKPEPLPEHLDRSTPPKSHPWKAPAREKINPDDYPQPTFNDFMNGPVATWRNALSPEFVPGKPHAMQNVKTSSSWWNGQATLKCESKTTSGGGWQAHGYGEASYISNGATFAKVYFRDGKLHGPCVFYNEDGTLSRVTCYSMGTSNGPYAQFANGRITVRGEYANAGEVVEWQGWGEQGKLSYRETYRVVKKTDGPFYDITVRRYYNDAGQLTKLYNYKNGEVDGPVQLWVEPNYDENGRMTNAGRVGRLELKYYDANNTVHGWQTFYDPAESFRKYDTWYEHGVQTGPFRAYHPDGKPRITATKQEGEYVGRFQEWTADGQHFDYNYGPDGKKQGSYVARNAEGKVTSKGTYRDNLPVGEWYTVGFLGDETWSNYNDNGLLHGEYRVENNETGKRQSGQYENGKQSGEWVYVDTGLWLLPYWTPLVSETVEGRGVFVNGARSGTWTYTVGDVKVGEGQFENGLRTGRWIYYHTDGTKGAEGNWFNSSRHGTWTEFHKSTGKVSTIQTYAGGNLSGRYASYDENGVILEDGNYAFVYGRSVQTGDQNIYGEDGVLTQRSRYDDTGKYLGMFERESELQDPPEGVELDPLKMNGIWCTYPSGSDVYTQRARIVNDQFAGLYEQFDTSGNKLVEGEVHGDSREGQWKYFYSTGQVKETAVFSANALNGEYNKYRTDGTLAENGTYTAGKKTGAWKLYHPDGKQPSSEINYNSEGSYEGASRTWDANGQMLTELFYANGVKHGVEKKWYEDGQQFTQANYTNGKLDGVYQMWYGNGQLSVETTFTSGHQTGTRKEWYKDGTPKLEHHFDSDGQPTGIWKDWNQDGTLKSETNHNPEDEQPEEEPGEESEE